jgi:hypothetical protein
MQATELDTVHLRERQLQRVFDEWASASRSAYRIAGAPPWMWAARGVNVRERLSAFDEYEFLPDVVWQEDSELYLFELKSAEKYQPLALAEALHHARVMQLRQSRTGGVSQRVTPVLVVRPSGWLRASVDYLLQSGLNEQALLYVEFRALCSQKSDFLWFDSPFERWTPADQVPALPPELDDGYRFWYRVRGNGTWFATTECYESRPVFWDSQFLCVSSLNNSEGALVRIGGRFPTVERYFHLDVLRLKDSRQVAPQRRWHWEESRAVLAGLGTSVSDELRRQRDLD